MGIKFCCFSRVLIIITAATGFHTAAIAQPYSNLQPQANETLAELFNQAFFQGDRDFFSNRSLGRQLNWIFGPGSIIQNSFAENEITRDASRIHTLYRNALELQVSSEPPIRTPDLPNPYETSILKTPAFNVNSPGDDIIFDKP